ncbi:MAG TPA: fumarylacetoacetate hydrolase family protein [Catalimonadaceae bacterium]|nr:fumarylacetoacetate hydrolase family protein [Catalimonadaceae bacterium]
MKIICVGRNYAAHIEELKNEKPTEPVIFLKPDTALVKHNEPVFHPEFTQDMHHEVEVVLRIGKEGKYIQPEFAEKYIDGIGLGIDFTARDLQSKLKAKGLPWEISKAFNQSAPVSAFIPKEEFGDLSKLTFHLDVNGETRQTGNCELMLFSFTEILVYVSQFFTLKTGDLIFTGTPEGVAKVKIGDRLQGYLQNRPMFDFEIR